MSFRVRHVVSAQSAFDYATSTGSLYDYHLSIAAIADELVRGAMWRAHIQTLILGSYAREFQEPTACITPDDFEKLALMLERYYADHIKEGAKAETAIALKLPKGTRYARNMKEFMAAAPKKKED